MEPKFMRYNIPALVHLALHNRS